MSVDSRTLGWLTRALTHEMSAVQQYLAQSVLARLWGDIALAEKLRHEAAEEMEHAERLMERLIQLGVAPSATNLAPVRLGRSRDVLLAVDRALEVDAVRLYQDALAHAQRMHDTDTAALLESILHEEIAHVNEIDDMKMEQTNHD
ncbi:ferritin-like domain-containing protein [Nitrosomonas halophila]|uniref:Bacterioferritin n=1 Tax=Nitrosomonas halophila TaxID=44576 RepID=A0A1H3BRM7_9PROT|nr:ferritin-like domain-containing protein [Nitrosomonas halophila]SDX44680.1 bacterioferritin [Nitrosomonas halophila]